MQFIIRVEDKHTQYQVNEGEMLNHFKKSLGPKECRKIDQIRDTAAFLIAFGEQEGIITWQGLVVLAQH